MSAINFPAALDAILQVEGGYSDNPADPGGATNLGITLATLSHWLGRPATIAEVQALTPETVAPIYHASYWQALQCDALPGGVDLTTFDIGVNSGPGRASRMLQEALGVTADGMIGPLTLRAAQARPAANTVIALAGARKAFYRALPDFPTFGRGWLARVDTILAASMRLVAADTLIGAAA